MHSVCISGIILLYVFLLRRNKQRIDIQDTRKPNFQKYNQSNVSDRKPGAHVLLPHAPQGAGAALHYWCILKEDTEVMRKVAFNFILIHHVLDTLPLCHIWWTFACLYFHESLSWHLVS